MKVPGTPTYLWRCLFLAGLICYSSCQSVSSTFENKTGQIESKPRVFSLRMDYDEWTPLGRGDPLKNNPTFDYVPPVLDRVQYWLDSHTTEPSAKRDILVLGVTAKKTSPKIPEQFLKFVDGPKFTRSNHQDVSFRNDFTGSTGAEPPKVLRTSNFRNGPIDYRNQNRIQSIPASYYPSPFYNQKAKPYTMMLPPPLGQKDKIVSFAEPTQQFNTQTEEGPLLQDTQYYASVPPPKNYAQHPGKSPGKFPPRSPVQTVSQVETIKSVYAPSSQPARTKYEGTTPSVSFEKSNLIYQSTQTLSGGWPNGNNAPFSTPTTSQTLDFNRDQYEIDHQPAASSNHEVVVEQNANIIVDGESNENEEVVIGQKGVDSSNAPTVTTIKSIENATGLPDENSKKMHIVVANETQDTKEPPVAVVMPTNYSEKKSNQASRNETPETTAISLETTTEANIPSTKGEPEESKIEDRQPVRLNLATGSSVLLPNRMMPPQQMHADSLVGFGAPQAPLSSLMHPQRQNAMHFMRPGVGFRAPASMSMFPPMTHMHAPPMRSTMNHMAQIMDHRPSLMQDYPTMFNSQMEEHFIDQHRSRAPETTTTVFTTPTVPPFLPTVSPSVVEPYTKDPEPSSSIKTTTVEEEPNEENQKKTSSSSPQITTVLSLTTDPIFSHYKQPAKPIRGPMYLIIQGHSKVKTYKPTVSKHGVPVERNEISEGVTERQLSKFEQFVQENTRVNSNRVNAVAIEKKKAEEKARAEKLALARQNDLMSLVESGFASFTVSPSLSTTTNSVTTIKGN